MECYYVIHSLACEVVGHEVGGEAPGTVAHAGVVVCVPAEHQHGAAGDNGRVQVPERSTVLQDGPVEKPE